MEIFVTLLLILWILFDVNYFIYALLTTVYGFIKGLISPIKLMDESVTYGLCMTNDMDFQWHMNNSKYLRNCDFARFIHATESNLYQTARWLGASMYMSGSNIRYRRSLQFLDVYRIHTKILCWDEKAIYLEQSFLRQKDSFVCAVCMVKMVVAGSDCSPQKVIDVMQPGTKSPKPLPEVSKWIDSIALSSERLRKSL
ncbi:protein THEM6-like [Haliotis rufescens]|uniref:protein THEM6-like n=1 Tax=Haliotis rufescens TaxID=6454 RepID=UPI00201EF90C|nr:protein THEM6-like [Haliotis rufescens]